MSFDNDFPQVVDEEGVIGGTAHPDYDVTPVEIKMVCVKCEADMTEEIRKSVFLLHNPIKCPSCGAVNDWRIVEELVEIVICPHCKTKTEHPYRKQPNGLFGNTIRCQNILTCGKTFFVTSALVRDKKENIIDALSRHGLDNEQTTLAEFYDHIANPTDLQDDTSLEVIKE